MDANLERAQDIILEKINHICREFGLNNIMAQLYAVLYLSDKALSLNNMSERLKISKGSVSVNIRALERYGVVRRVWVKGSRKDYYEAETDVSKVILDRIRSMINRRLSEMKDMIDSVENILGTLDVEDKREIESLRTFRQRVHKLKNVYNKAQSLFNLVNSGIFRGLLKQGEIKKVNKKGIFSSI